MPTLNIVSPHHDDAALSLSATMRTSALHGVRLRIFNCFTVSGWAPQLDSKLNTCAVTAIRKHEDARFLELICANAEAHDLGFHDAPLRPD